MTKELLEAMVKERGGNIFWVIMISLAVVGLFYLGLWGYAENNFRAITVSMIFATMLIFSVAFLGKNLFLTKETLAQSCTAFWAGALLWGGIAWLAQSPAGSILTMFTITPQTMLSSVAQQMPAFWQAYILSWSAATVEELMFLLTIPLLVFIMLKGIAKYFPIFENMAAQITIAIIISSLTFAFFHTGQAMFISFVIAAMVFRGIQLGLYWGDTFWDIVPFTAMLGAFAVGAHWANNIFSFGLQSFLNIMMSEPFGWVLLGVLALFIIIPITAALKGEW